MEEHSEQSCDLLPKYEHRISDEYRYKHERHRSTIYTWQNSILLVIVSLLGYIAVRVTFFGSSQCNCQAPTAVDENYVVVPKDVLQYEERPEWYQPRSPWNQEPSEELDIIWTDLLRALNIRITSAEMSYLNANKTNRVQVTGGDHENDHEYDYVGVLGVYHHLHCLNNLRRVIHWDYYGPLLTDAKHPEGLSIEHSDHCIDTIRQALMCNANTGVYTSEWDYETHNPSRSLETRSSTTCVRWDSLDSWARERALVPGEYKYIRGPYDPDRPVA
ncbi:hypothetical protein F4861DRAFT_335712 [Xylaria intraflava]|nr:hypothetical protein F4861DRAFT_335712 [Xylaria intraflava]